MSNITLPELLPIDKSQYELTNIIKKNLITLLVNRNFIDESNKIKYTNKLILDENDDQEYIIEIDNDTNYNTTIINKKIFIKFFDYKITSINKSSPIGEFIAKYANEYKILLVDEINQKSENIIDSYNITCEIFKISELMINITEHVLVPKHIVLTNQEGDKVLQSYCAKKKDMPLILSNDPMARYYNMKPGNIVKIIRSSTMTVEVPFYRIVIKSKVLKIKT